MRRGTSRSRIRPRPPTRPPRRREGPPLPVAFGGSLQGLAEIVTTILSLAIIDEADGAQQSSNSSSSTYASSSSSSSSSYTASSASSSSSSSSSSAASSSYTSSSQQSSSQSAAATEQPVSTATTTSSSSTATATTALRGKLFYQSVCHGKDDVVRVLSLALTCDSPGAYYYGSSTYRNSEVCVAGDKATLKITGASTTLPKWAWGRERRVGGGSDDYHRDSNPLTPPATTHVLRSIPV